MNLPMVNLAELGDLLVDLRLEPAESADRLLAVGCREEIAVRRGIKPRQLIEQCAHARGQWQSVGRLALHAGGRDDQRSGVLIELIPAGACEFVEPLAGQGQ